MDADRDKELLLEAEAGFDPLSLRRFRVDPNDPTRGVLVCWCGQAHGLDDRADKC